MVIPDEYIRSVADAVHAVGGICVLDCVASGCIWIDMEATGVDVLITAPQKVRKSVQHLRVRIEASGG